MFSFVKKGSDSIFQYLINNGADVNAKAYEWAEIPLQWAVKYGEL